MYCEGKRWRDVRREGFMMSVLMVMTAVDWSPSRHDNGYSPSQTVPVTTLTDLTLPRFHLIHNGIQASTRPPEHGNESSSVLTKTLPPTLPTRGSTRKPLARHVTTRRGGIGTLTGGNAHLGDDPTRMRTSQIPAAASGMQRGTERGDVFAISPRLHRCRTIPSFSLDQPPGTSVRRYLNKSEMQ